LEPRPLAGTGGDFVARDKLTPGKLKQLRREIDQDDNRKTKAIQALQQDFRGFVESNFELDENQRREFDDTPKELHDMGGQACATALEKGWDIELVHEEGRNNLRIEIGCKLSGECGVRISC
jgi:hypothetical protein